MQTLTYVVPSRERVAKIRELIDAWASTRTTAELFVAVDSDDPQIAEYRSLLRDAPDWVHWGSINSDRMVRGMVAALNYVAKRIISRTDIIGFMGDDHRPRTVGWDKMIIGAQQTPCIAYGNDLLQGPVLPTQVAMPASFVKALGYMAPPTLTHLYVDNFWKMIGEALERLTYVPDCIIEHMHPIAGKAAWDDIYVDVNSGDMYYRDSNAFSTYVSTCLTADIEKIRTVL